MITDKTRRDIQELAEGGEFNNCNTNHSLIELVKQMTFSGMEQSEAVRMIARIYQVVSEEIA
jgi:hypothetical protein